MVSVGIDKISYYIPPYFLDLRDLAKARNIPEEKFLTGIGQSKMAVPSRDQDVIALGANAASKILSQEDKETVDMILFATESSIDYSKASANYLHELLEIQPFAKSLEVKQACYSGTGALQIACDYVRVRPQRKVLVVMSDISRYGLENSAEVTQGAGAVALLVTAQPRILAIEMENLAITHNQFDFWRPSYFSEALVDGKFSNHLYLEMFTQIMEEYYRRSPEKYQLIETMLFHLPYSKMGAKALKSYAEIVNLSPNKNSKVKQWEENYSWSTVLSKSIGNIYTGSLYLSLISALMYNHHLKEGQLLGLFSYGSGAVAELIVGTLQVGFMEQINLPMLRSSIENRQQISVEAYEEMFKEYFIDEKLGKHLSLSSKFPGFYLKEVKDHQRIYGYNID